jgi:hypothetical protein
MPGILAYHSTVVHRDCAYTFGGNNYDKLAGDKFAEPLNAIIF